MNSLEELRIPSAAPKCKHLEIGLCSRCKLKEAFNLSDNEPTLSTPSSSTSTAAKTEVGKTEERRQQQKETEGGDEPREEVDLGEDAMEMDDKPSELSNGKSEREELRIGRIEPILEQQAMPPPPAPTGQTQSWLLRLFESKMFNVTIAMQYLFNSKEPGVLTYLGR